MRTRIPERRLAGRAARWLGSRLEPRARVLGYHRIAEPGADPLELCTSPARFAQHLEILRREANPIVLGELLAGLRARRLPRRSVVVTLDDGYSETLHHALPALEAHGVPSTVIVTTGLLGRKSWWDMLARPSQGYGSVQIELDGYTLHWRSPEPAPIRGRARGASRRCSGSCSPGPPGFASGRSRH